MADLSLDMKLLEQLKSDLEAIHTEFANADHFSDDTSHATGHDDLASHVRDFAHKWNDKRKEMTEAVDGLSKSVGAVTDGFSKVDAGLAKALEDGAAKSKQEGVPEK